MKYMKILLLFLPVMILTACEDYEDERTVRSGGGIDEILIILPNDDYKTPFSDTLAELFQPIFPGLPQPEFKYDVRIRNFAQFENSELLQKYRNIIFTATFDEENEVSEIIRKRIGEQNIDRAHGDSTFFFAIQRNVYAEPQLVVYLFAPDEQSLLRRLSDYRDFLFREISLSEQKRLAGAVYFSGTNKEIINTLQQKFDLSLNVPGDYSMIEEDSNFIWITKQDIFHDNKDNIIKEVKKNILIHTFPLDSSRFFAFKNEKLDSLGYNVYPFYLRDSIAEAHVFGRTREYTMYTDMKRPLFQDKKVINNIPVTISRGLWRMDNPFMGGPFMNYAIVDEKNDRILIIDAFVYAAGSKKRREIRELETILSSLSFPK